MNDAKQDHRLCVKAEYAHDIIGKKWTSLIIHTLMDSPKRFSEIQAIIPDLSKRMLNERMKELEENEIIERRVIAERPVRVVYSLTQKGTELGNALVPVEEWASRWL